jgi:hypothetical protein
VRARACVCACVRARVCVWRRSKGLGVEGCEGERLTLVDGGQPQRKAAAQQQLLGTDVPARARSGESSQKERKEKKRGKKRKKREKRKGKEQATGEVP